MSIQLLHLYPDLMNLYGEYANVAALRRSLERQGAEVVVRTGTLYEDIDFSGADFLYMGAGTESAQLVALEDLRRYEGAIRAALERGAVVLATGNAMELFGSSITSPDGRVFGKMGHSERIGKGLYKNVPGDYNIRMFEAAVKYFK